MGMAVAKVSNIATRFIIPSEDPVLNMTNVSTGTQTRALRVMYIFDVILTVHRHKYVEVKYQIDATEVFIADLIACLTCFRHHYAHHQELKSVIQWLLPVVFRAVVFKLLVWCGAEGYVSDLQDAAA